MALRLGQRLTVLATSDLHGRFIPSESRPTSPSSGSLAQFSSLVHSVKAESTEVIALDCGDLLRDSAQACILARPEYHHLRAQLFDRVGYDAVAPGNHDFGENLTPHSVSRILCNIKDPTLSPGVILTRGGMKIAVTAILTRQSPVYPDQPAILSPRDALSETIKMIQSREKPDILIGLFHAGLDETQEFSQLFPAFDLIVFGHDHTSFIGRTPSGTLLVNPGAYGENAAKITFNGDTIDAELIPLSKVAPDPYFLSLFPVAELNEKVIDLSTTTLSERIHALLHSLTGAAVTAVPPLRSFSKDNLSAADLYGLLPYDDYPSIARLTGTELKESGLHLKIHTPWKSIDDETLYSVGSDSHSLHPCSIISRFSIQDHLLSSPRGGTRQN